MLGGLDYRTLARRLAGSLGASLVGFARSDDTAFERTVRDKELDIVSVKDFKNTDSTQVLGNASRNNSSGIQRALTAAAAIGFNVFVPAAESGGSYYMGTTGLTLTGRVTMHGTGASSLVWDAAFTGTALTVTGNYNCVDNVGFWMPKSVGVPNANIIGIDVQGPLNRLRKVIIDQTSAGNNNPWYTGVKIGGISNSIEALHIYAYDKAVAYTSGSPRNDLTIIDSELVAQITAVIHMQAGGTLSVIGCDIEANGGACAHGVWLESSTSSVVGAYLAGNYLAGFTANGVWVNGTVGQIAQGVTLIGNEINCSAATNAIKATYTNGLVVLGGYHIGGTNWLNLDTSNINYTLLPGYTSGALAVSGTASPAPINAGWYAFPATQNPSANANILDDYEEGTFTPVLAGSGTPGTQTYAAQSGYYTKIGNRCLNTISILLSAKDAATAGDLRITGLPFLSANVGGNQASLAIGRHQNIDLNVAGGYYQVEATIAPNASLINLNEAGDNVAIVALTAADFNATTLIEVSGHYRTE